MPLRRSVALDRPCLASIERGAFDSVAECDTDATQVLLAMADLGARLSLAPRLLGYEDSGDTGGDRERVVGYGALVYEDRFQLGDAEQAALLKLARRAVEERVRHGRNIEPAEELVAHHPRLAALRGAFVTLKKGGQLRGCIGSLSPREPLARDVAHNAVSDPRFQPVQPDELAALELSISVLDLPRPAPQLGPDALVKLLAERRPGVVLEYLGRRSTFLPSVWEEIPEAEPFLAALCRKQGSDPGCWRARETKVELYGAQYFGEKR